MNVLSPDTKTCVTTASRVILTSHGETIYISCLSLIREAFSLLRFRFLVVQVFFIGLLSLYFMLSVTGYSFTSLTDRIIQLRLFSFLELRYNWCFNRKLFIFFSLLKLRFNFVCKERVTQLNSYIMFVFFSTTKSEPFCP